MYIYVVFMHKKLYVFCATLDNIYVNCSFMDACVLARPAERPSDGLDQMDIVPVEMDII